MKKLKSLFLKLKSKTTIKTYQKPLMVTILVLLSINVIILLVATAIAMGVDKTYYSSSHYHDSFIEAFVSCLTWMIAPNSITKFDIQTDKFLMAVAAIVIVIEMILFSGAIVAMLTTALRAYIDKKSHAKGKIILNNHFVILNWNSKVPDMIYNLIEKNYQNNVLILSDTPREKIYSMIESVISANTNNRFKQKTKLKLIVKDGNPLLMGDLSDISIEKASNIVIVSREDMAEGDDENITNSDLYSLKVVLALGNFDIKKECNIVCETDMEATKKKIERLSKTVKSLKNKSIIAVSFNRKIGQMIGQTIVTPELANIYLELLSFEGAEFYSYGEQTVHNYFKNYNNAIPIIKYHKLFVLAEGCKD